MKLSKLLVVGVLTIGPGLAHSAYLVELDGGDRMTVDRYWADGDRIHLMDNGVDLSVPRSRIRAIRETSDPEAPRPRSASPEPTAHPSSASREELEARQNTIERHLLRVQQERFEAEARGEPAARLGRLEKEFHRTQKRRLDVMRALERAGD